MSDSSGPMGLMFFAMFLVLIGVPMALGSWRRPESKWGAIALSTFVSPFLMMGMAVLTVGIYMALAGDHGSSGCSGGECGPALYAAGYAPLLLLLAIPTLMVPSFVVSTLIILLIRSARQ